MPWRQLADASVSAMKIIIKRISSKKLSNSGGRILINAQHSRRHSLQIIYDA
jgi:hypothetical protein